MKGDYSRFSFDKKKRYSAVLMQQGRLQLDSDWNEQVQIAEHRNTALFRDLVGRSGTPQGKAMALQQNGTALSLSEGVYYIEGLFLENHAPLVLKSEEVPATNGSFLYYLDAWAQEINAVEDEELVDPAVGQETTTRLKTEWRLRCQPIAAAEIAAFRAGRWPEEGNRPASLATAHWWRPLGTGKLTLSYDAIPPDAVYLKDNRLLRIEIHEVTPLENGTSRVQFKWSSNNASVCAEVEADGEDAYKLTSNYLHMEDFFKGATCIELCAPGQTTGYLLEAPLENGVLELDEDCPPAWRGLNKALIRRWDGTFLGGKNNAFEKSVGLVLLHEEAGFYRAGDHWFLLIRDGKILNWKSGEKKLPEGVEHHFAALGVLTRNNANMTLEDLRVLFDPLTDPNLSTTGGASIGENLTVKGNTNTGSLTVQPYSAQANYPVNSRCADANGLLYKALRASGPGNGGAQPLSNAAYWMLADVPLLPTFTTAGTGAAYTITSNLIPNPVPEGFRFRMKFHITNTGTSQTLNINGSGALGIRHFGTVAAAGFPSGRLVNDTVWDVERVGNFYVLVGSLLPNASETAAGIVQLNNTTSNTSTAMAATANAVRLAATDASNALTTHNNLLAGTGTTPGHIRVTVNNGLNISNGVLSMAAGTITAPGAVQLNNATDSQLQTQAATANAVNVVNNALTTHNNLLAGTGTTPGHIRVTAGNGLNIASGVLSMLLGSTTAAGALQLNDSINSTSTTQAATANSVRNALAQFRSVGSSAAGYCRFPNGMTFQFSTFAYYNTNLIPPLIITQTVTCAWPMEFLTDAGYIYFIESSLYSSIIKIDGVTKSKANMQVKCSNIPPGFAGILNALAIGLT